MQPGSVHSADGKGMLLMMSREERIDSECIARIKVSNDEAIHNSIGLGSIFIDLQGGLAGAQGDNVATIAPFPFVDNDLELCMR